MGSRSLTICHTADWHLGHTLHGRSREHEHAAFLAWLVELLVEREVDALIVAGDVFDGATPTGAAQALFFEMLASLRARAPAIEVIVIAGNHDSPSRLAAPDPVLRRLGVRLIGSVPWVGRGRAQRIDPGPLVVPLRAKDGEIAAWVAAVPYLRACDLPPELEGDEADAAERIARGTRAVYDAVAAHARSLASEDQALIVTGHCHVAGAVLSDASERPVLGGLAGALPPDVLPADASYVALGHLHLAQDVGRTAAVARDVGRPTQVAREEDDAPGERRVIAYSGSPIPLALGEASYPHQVRLVELEGRRVVACTSCLVPRAVPILRVPAAGPAPLEAVLEALRALEVPEPGEDEARWPWLEARVLLERAEPALRARVEEAIAGKPVRLVKITVEHARAERAGAGPERVRELAELELREVFLRRWASEHEGAPPDDVLAAFDEACAAAQQAGEAP